MRKQFIIDACGIFVSYFVFGVIQEKITRGTYSYTKSGETYNEHFTFALILVFVLCFLNYILSKCMLSVRPEVEDKTPRVYYASVAMTYLLAMVCSNMALQWVSYPTQVVGKSAKPIPVMILGVLVGRKSYPIQKYVFVFLIVIGVVLFMYKDNDVLVQQEDVSFGLGELLLILSLTMDGLTGAIQERMRAESKPSGLQMMKASNAWSTVFLVCAILLSGELFEFTTFASRHPMILPNLLILGMTQAVGQIFLYSMVSHFGPLVVSVVTTTRKFFTVLASVIIFGNVIGARQWIGAFVVFAGLFLDAYFSKKSSNKPK